jgi:O-antigen ligase
MSNSITTADIESRRAVSRLLFWALVVAFTFPFRFDFTLGPFTTISTVDIVLILCSAYFAIIFLALVPVRTGPPIIAAAVLVPALLALGSLLWTANGGLTAATIVKYSYAALIYFVALQLDLDVKTLGRACLVILFGWLLGSLAMYLNVPGFAFFIPQSLALAESETLHLFASVYTRLGHPYVGQSNDYGPLLALLGFLLLACAKLRQRPWLIAASWLAFLSSLLTFSRGMMVGLFAALALYAWLARVPIKRVATVTGATVVLSSLLVFATAEFSVVIEDREIPIRETVESRLSDVNVVARLEGYLETLELVLERPLLGYGAGYFDRTHPDALMAAHNALLEQWKYFGLVLGTLSMACYLLITAYFFRARLNPGANPFYNAMACAWVFLLVTSLAETLFEATTPRAFIYFTLGLCVRPPLTDPAEASGRLNAPPLPPDARTIASSRERA